MKINHTLVTWLMAILAASAQTVPEENAGPSKEIIAKATRATVIVRTKVGHGSGFIISTNGYLLTNYHVIEGAPQAVIEFNDGLKRPVLSALAYSPKTDLALLRIAPGNYECLDLEDPKSITLGDPLFIIGHPHGHWWTLTKGYLAGKRREDGRPVIQFSADISPGNSGGPVMNLAGRVCGIATYIERQKLEFGDGKYVLDPSSVLKFGVAVDAFYGVTNKTFSKQYSLAELAAFNQRIHSLNHDCPVLTTTASIG